MSNKLGNKLCRPSLFERVSRVPTLFDPDRRRNCRYRLNTDRDQAIDHVAFVFLAWTVGIRPDDDVAPSKWRPVWAALQPFGLVTITQSGKSFCAASADFSPSATYTLAKGLSASLCRP